MVPCPRTFPPKKELSKVYEKLNMCTNSLKKKTLVTSIRGAMVGTGMIQLRGFCRRRICSKAGWEWVSPEIRIFRFWLWYNGVTLNRSHIFPTKF